MFRAVFIIVSYLCLAGGFVVAVMDGTRSLGMGSLFLTSTGEFVQSRLPNLPVTLFRLHPLLWDPVGQQIMRLPMCLFLGGLGLLILIIASRKPERRGFAKGI